ncbi:MAG: VWA domain-containing protein [Planctomycetota bacterium]
MKLLTAILSLGLVAGALAQGELGALLENIRENRSESTEKRLPEIRALLGMKSPRARRAALDLFTKEGNLEIAALLLEHAAELPDMDSRMLSELENAKSQRIRVVAARYFVRVHGKEGVGLLVDLVDQKIDKMLHIACLQVLAEVADEAAAEAFLKLFEIEASSVRYEVLLGLRGRNGEHIDQVRRKGLKDPYQPLRGEAIYQLASAGDAKALGMARRLARGRVDERLAPLLFEALAQRRAVRELSLMGALLRVDSSRMRETVEKMLPDLLKNERIRAWATGPAIEKAGPDSRRMALLLLKKIEGDRATRTLLYLCKDRNSRVRTEALFCLAKRKDRRCVPFLEHMLHAGGVEEKLDALLALDMIQGDDPEHLERVVALVSSPDVGLRLLAMDLAGRHEAKGLLRHLPSLVKYRDWRVRIGAARAATKVRDKSMIPCLIEQLGVEKGRVAQEMRDSLASLTRLYFHDPEHWRSWWKRNGESFVLPPPPKPKQQDGPRLERRGGTKASFYGIPVESNRVIYCLDVSGSMRKRSGTGPSRLSRAKLALTQALKHSAPESWVNVIFFDTEVKPYSKRMIPISDKRKFDKLLEFIRQAEPLGSTNIHGALLKALKDSRVDTIFLLSDGEPSAGDITDADELARDILRRNRTHRVVFQCIAVGEPSSLLERLAKESGGSYVER